MTLSSRLLNSREFPLEILKDCSELKRFGSVITADYFITPELFHHQPKGNCDTTLVLPENHIYQVSSLFPVEAEYRIYVLHGEIENIACYDGDCTIPLSTKYLLLK